MASSSESSDNKKRSRAWRFTIQHYTTQDVSSALTLMAQATKFAMQEEHCHGGVPVLQGMVYFETQRTKKSVQRHFRSKAQVERAKDAKSGFQRCTSTVIRTGRVWSKGIDGERQYSEAQLRQLVAAALKEPVPAMAPLEERCPLFQRVFGVTRQHNCHRWVWSNLMKLAPDLPDIVAVLEELGKQDGWDSVCTNLADAMIGKIVFYNSAFSTTTTLHPAMHIAPKKYLDERMGFNARNLYEYQVGLMGLACAHPAILNMDHTVLSRHLNDIEDIVKE